MNRAAVNAVNEVLPKTTTAVQQSASLQGAGDLDYPAPVFSDNDMVGHIEKLHAEESRIRQDNLKRLIFEEAQRTDDANARAAKLERDLAKQHEEYRLLHGFASMMLVGCIILLILQFR